MGLEVLHLSSAFERMRVLEQRIMARGTTLKLKVDSFGIQETQSLW